MACQSIITPVGTTDYLGNSSSGGGGSDLTSSLGVTVDRLAATGVTLTISNSGSTNAYLTLMQVRSAAVLRTYDAVHVTAQDDDSIAAYTERSESINLGVRTDPDNLVGLATWILANKASPRSLPTAVRLTNASASLYGSILDLTVGDLITLSEPESALSGTWRIWAEDHEVRGARHDVSYILEPYNNGGWWIIGTSAIGSARIAY
jgi:hypothetical protein